MRVIPRYQQIWNRFRFWNANYNYYRNITYKIEISKFRDRENRLASSPKSRAFEYLLSQLSKQKHSLYKSIIIKISETMSDNVFFLGAASTRERERERENGAANWAVTTLARSDHLKPKQQDFCRGTVAATEAAIINALIRSLIYRDNTTRGFDTFDTHTHSHTLTIFPLELFDKWWQTMCVWFTWRPTVFHSMYMHIYPLLMMMIAKTAAAIFNSQSNYCE